MSIETLKQWLFRRKYAYRMVFNRENEFTKEVLGDLSKFCRAHESTYHQDPRLSGILEGRREVWLRIQNHLQLSDEELWKIFSQQQKG